MLSINGRANHIIGRTDAAVSDAWRRGFYMLDLDGDGVRDPAFLGLEVALPGSGGVQTKPLVLVAGGLVPWPAGGAAAVTREAESVVANMALMRWPFGVTNPDPGPSVQPKQWYDFYRAGAVIYPNFFSHVMELTSAQFLPSTVTYNALAGNPTSSENQPFVFDREFPKYEVMTVAIDRIPVSSNSPTYPTGFTPNTDYSTAVPAPIYGRSDMREFTNNKMTGSNSLILTAAMVSLRKQLPQTVQLLTTGTGDLPQNVGRIFFQPTGCEATGDCTHIAIQYGVISFGIVGTLNKRFALRAER